VSGVKTINVKECLTLYRILAATVNSLYSFWWDVSNDWGLMFADWGSNDVPSRDNYSPSRRQLSPEASQPQDIISRRHSDQSLHPTIYFPVSIYPCLILLDFVLRLTWSFQLLNVVNVKSHAGLASFFLKSAELLRRWLWVFVRVEWEMIKKGESGTRTSDSDLTYELVPSPSVERP